MKNSETTSTLSVLGTRLYSMSITVLLSHKENSETASTLGTLLCITVITVPLYSNEHSVIWSQFLGTAMHP